MTKAHSYNIELCKGTGTFQETLLLLELYHPDIKKEQFLEMVINSNVLVKSSEKRITDIVNVVFYKRYAKNDPQVPVYLEKLHSSHISLDQLIQIMMIYMTRSNRILFDFITDVYWNYQRENHLTITSKDAMVFINEAVKYGRIERSWSEGTKKRVASYMIASLIDIKFIDRKYQLMPVFLTDTTVNYLVHELHFKGYSDEAIATAEEWKLFGYDQYDTVRHLERLAIQGHFIFQNAGDLIRITWHYKTMIDLIDAIRQ